MNKKFNEYIFIFHTTDENKNFINAKLNNFHLENVEVIMWTNETMTKLLDVINPDHENSYNIPWVNRTVKKNNILDETSNNINLFEEYKEKFYNANLRHHLDKMNILFNDGIYRGKLTDFVVKDYPELKNMNSMMD